MLILDRLEAETAWIEGEEGVFPVPRDRVSPAAREGDVLRLNGDLYVPDPQQTQERRDRMRQRLRRLLGP